MLPRQGSYEGWEQVAETRQVYEAELIALRLRECGIDAEVLDQSFKQEPLPSVRSFSVVRVLVPAARAAQAREVLSRSVALPEEASELGDEASERPEEASEARGEVSETAEDDPEPGSDPAGSVPGGRVLSHDRR